VQGKMDERGVLRGLQVTSGDLVELAQPVG
jgi:hypothetical protein